MRTLPAPCSQSHCLWHCPSPVAPSHVVGCRCRYRRPPAATTIVAATTPVGIAATTTTCRGRFNLSKSKSDTDWKMYHAARRPGSCSRGIPCATGVGAAERQQSGDGGGGDASCRRAPTCVRSQGAGLELALRFQCTLAVPRAPSSSSTSYAHHPAATRVRVARRTPRRDRRRVTSRRVCVRAGGLRPGAQEHPGAEVLHVRQGHQRQLPGSASLPGLPPFLRRSSLRPVLSRRLCGHLADGVRCSPRHRATLLLHPRQPCSSRLPTRFRIA